MKTRGDSFVEEWNCENSLFDNPGAIRYYEYESNGKIEKFTGALYIIKEEYNDQVLNKENEEQSDKDDIFGRAIQMYEISSDLNNSGNIYLQKDKGEPLGKLIELNYKDEDKEWYLSYSPEKNDMMRVVVFKEVSQNGDAQLKLVNDSYKYLGVTDQDPLSESLNSIGETVAEDFLVSCIQATPVLGDKLKTVYDVTSKAIDAIDPYTEAKKNKEAVEIGELGTLVDFFDLMVVPVDVESSGKEGDEDDSGYSYSLYKTSSTQDRIDEFNNYMENNPLEAKFFEYDKLPDGKLTLDYIIDNPEDVEEMVSWYMDQCGTASTSSEELISGQGDEEINSETE